MNKQTITFTASEQTLTKTGGIEHYASNIVSYIEASFTLGDNWAGYDSIRAVWESGYARIATVLDANNKCIVPAEVLTYKSKVNVNLVGSIVENAVLTDRLTTYPILALTVDADARVDSSETTPVTASQFEQFVDVVRDEASAIQNYTYDSEAWAVGQRAGVDVPSTDETYHNNAKYYADQGATLQQEVTDLKSDINEIVIRSNNRLNLATITKDTYINVDGTSTASANFSVTDYIPVTAGETIYWWSKRTDNSYYLFDARFLCAYNSSKVAVSASGSTFVGGSYTVPSGIAYIRLSISNTYLSDWTNFYAGTLTLDEHDEYLPYGEVKSLINQPQVDENTANIAINTQNIAETTETIENITEPSSNLLDISAITANKYITAGGVMDSIATLSVTDYIPVTAGESIYAWGMSNGAYSLITFRFVCAYDVNKNAVEASGYNSETNPPYVVPNGIAYLRLTLRNTSLELSNLYIGTHSVGVDYEPYGRVVKLPDSDDSTHSISSGQSLLEAVKYCYTNNIKNLIVEAGTYDIIEEYKSYYGNSYFDDYIDYAQGDLFDAGIWLQNINVKFSAGAKVICKYTGNNANVPLYFSAFATGNNVEIDGLVLDAENLRYGIHADYNSGTDETFFRVKNCDLKHYKNAISMQAIGAGFGRHVFWEIENTIFRSAGGNHIVFRVHNNVNSDAQSKLIVKDCYIDGDGYFKFNAYSTSTLQSIIQVCGCSYKTAPVVGRETSDSNDNFTMIAWNNELRS